MKTPLVFFSVLLSLVPSAHALTPEQLNPDEKKQYDQIKSDPAAAKTYLDTRGFFKECLRVKNGQLAAKDLPVQPADYDKADVTTAEQKIVDDAAFQNIMALIGG